MQINMHPIFSISTQTQCLNLAKLTSLANFQFPWIMFIVENMDELILIHIWFCIHVDYDAVCLVSPHTG